MNQIETKSGDTLKELTVRAEDPSEEFRSIWTDLRGVSFTQGWTEVDGTKVRYLRSGPSDGPKLIMLPGTGGHAETYVPNLGPLGKHFDCWAIDIPGSGYSDKHGESFDAIHTARFIKQFADNLGASQIDLIGCSVGSWAALQVAVLYPDLVRHLILSSPAGGPLPDEGDAWYPLWNMPDIGGEAGRERLELAKSPTWEGVESVLRSLMPDKRRLPDDMLAARLDANRQPNAAEVVEKVNWWFDRETRLANTLTREQLRRIDIPVLGITEVNDQSLAIVQAMFACLPNSELIRVEGVGHWPHYEDSGTFNRLAIDFLTNA